MADCHHFEKPLNCHNSAVVQPIAMKFGMMTPFDRLEPSDGQKFDFLKQRCWTPDARMCPHHS